MLYMLLFLLLLGWFTWRKRATTRRRKGAGSMNFKDEERQARFIVSLLVLVCFFFVIGALFYALICGFLSSVSTEMIAFISLILGNLSSKFGTVVDYWLGSSKSSQDKDAAITASSSSTKSARE